MKKIGTYFIAVLLSFVVLVGLPVKAEASGFSEAGIVNMISLGINLISNYAAGTSEHTRGVLILQNSWYNQIPSGSAYRIQVSGDVLSQAVYDLTQRGIPCQIVANSTLNGYVIRCTGEPRDPATGSYLDPSWTYTNRYFCSGSNQYYIYYSTELPTSYNAGLIRSQLTTVITALQTLNSNVSSILSSLGSAVSARLNDMTSWLGSIDNRLTVTNTRLSAINTSVGTLDSTLEALSSVVSKTQYVSGYSTNSSGTAFSTITLPYDIATAYCAYLNSNFVGKPVSFLLRDEDTVSSFPTFEFANVESNKIRIHVIWSNGTTGSTYLCTLHHVLFNVASPNNINISGNVSATLNDTNIVNALNTIQSTLNGMGGGSGSGVVQYCLWHTEYTDGTVYPVVTIPYESAVNLVAILNAELQGKTIGYLKRDLEEVNSNATFRQAYLSNGYIRVLYNAYTTGGAYLMTKNHIVIKYSDPMYLSQLSMLHDDLIEHIDAIHDWLDNADLATNESIRELQESYNDDFNGFGRTARKILKLFKSVFGSVGSDFGGATDYFSELGEDAT